MTERIPQESAKQPDGGEKEIILKSEQRRAANEMIKALSGGSVDDAIAILDESNLPKEFLQSSEVQEVTKKLFVKTFGSYIHINHVTIIRDKFELSEEFVQEVAEKEIIKRLESGSTGEVLGILNKFNLSEEFIQSPEVQELAKKGLAERFRMGALNYIFDVIRIQKKFNLPEEFVQEVAKKEFVKRLDRHSIDDAIKIRDKFKLSEEFVKSSSVQEIAKKEGVAEKLNES